MQAVTKMLIAKGKASARIVVFDALCAEKANQVKPRWPGFNPAIAKNRKVIWDCAFP
jgi:hypothetical protein